MGQHNPQYLPLSRTNFALLLIRIAAGLIFLMHGYQKLFDFGYGGTRDSFDAWGVPLPALTALISITLELGGGLMLIAGVYTRIVGFLFALEMFVAFIVVHVTHGFFVANNGVELVLLLGAVSLAFVIAGAGQYSFDEMWRLPFSGDWATIISGGRR